MSDTKIPRGRRVRPPAETKPEPTPPAVSNFARDSRSRMEKVLEAKETLSRFFDDMEADLRLLDVLTLICHRASEGSPVEEFLHGLMITYHVREQEQVPMTIEDIDREFTGLRDIFPTSVRQAHFIAKRYPMPAAEENGGERQ